MHRYIYQYAVGYATDMNIQPNQPLTPAIDLSLLQSLCEDD